MRMLAGLVFLFPLLGIPIFVSAPVCAQSEAATVSGRVTDAQGRVVPDVKIQLVNTETNLVQATRTNSEGLYVVPDVRPGTYRILVLKDGFKEIVKTGLVLHVQDIAAENFSLQVGSMSESVTVLADQFDDEHHRRHGQYRH